MTAAEKLVSWFDELTRFSEVTLFAVARDERHRRAAILDVLTSNARKLNAGNVDSGGALYQPAAFVLAATSKLTGLVPNVSHWRSALENVHKLREDLAAVQRSQLGLSAGSAATILKNHFTEALVQAGVAGLPSTLDEDDCSIALGLSINWGIRFIVAYALETALPERKPRRGGQKAGTQRSAEGLAWLQGVVSRAA